MKRYSYSEYLAISEELFNSGRTTSEDASYNTPEILEYTKVNFARIHRLNKTVVINDELSALIKSINTPMLWTVLTESWCGDVAQVVPVIAKAASLNPNFITLELALRDKNLELMDKFLTNGGRAIPKLIVENKETQEVLGAWGPRPTLLQDEINEWKSKGLSLKQYMESIHSWYAQDKTETTQTELYYFFKGILK